MQVERQIKTFGGTVYKLKHSSSALGCEMRLNVFIPPKVAAKSSEKLPVLFFLSGLTCTADNALEKGYLTPAAAKHGIALVFPDTSPRGAGVAGEDDDSDLGTGAGFYLDASEEPWAKNYNMETYITKELRSAVFDQFSNLDNSRVGITGHSMGGHGALTLFLRHPGAFQSVSAFSPISNPTKCPWGQKAFSNYLGRESAEWAAHDATELIQHYKGPKADILVDIGTADPFLEEQLLPRNFEAAAKDPDLSVKLDLRLQDGYDHSYFFVSTFAADHVEHHAKILSSI